MFIKSYRFHLLKLGLNKSNLAVVSTFLGLTFFLILLLNVLALSNPNLSYISFITVAFTSLFFISIINILLTYAVFQTSKTSRIESIEKRSGMGFWEMFFSRSCSIKTVTILYITLVIVFWTIIVSSLQLNNYAIIFKVFTPGLCFLYIYDFAFYSIVSFLLIWGKQKLALILSSILATLGAMTPIVIGIFAVIGGGFVQPLAEKEIINLKTKIKLLNESESSYQNGIIELIRNSAEIKSIISETEASKNANWSTASGVDKIKSEISYFINNSSTSSYWIESNTMLDYANILNAMFQSVYKLEGSNETITFDVFEYTPEFKESNFAVIYKIAKEIFETKNFSEGSKNDSAYISQTFSSYSAEGQFKATTKFLTSKTFVDEFKIKTKELGIVVTDQEWNLLVSQVNMVFMKQNIKINPSNNFPSYLNANFKTDFLKENDLYGLKSFFATFYKIMTASNNFSYYKSNNSAIERTVENLSIFNSIFNAFTYSGAHSLIDYSAAFSYNLSISNSLPPIDLHFFAKEVEIEEGNVPRVNYKDIYDIQVKQKNWVGISYITFTLFALILMALGFIVYKNKLYEK